MTKGQLKNRLSPTLFHSIMNIANDQTLGESKKDQIFGLLFHVISGGDYWEECDNNEEI